MKSTAGRARPGAAREQERAGRSKGRQGGVRGTERSPAGSPLPRRHCPPARPPARAEPRRVRPGASGAPASGPDCPVPALPPPGRARTRALLPSRRRWAPTWLCSTLGLRGAVRARSSSSAPAERSPEARARPAPPRRRVSSVSRAAGPGPAPIGPSRRPSRPARLRAGRPVSGGSAGQSGLLLLLCHRGAAAAPGGGAGNSGRGAEPRPTCGKGPPPPPLGGAAGSRPGPGWWAPVDAVFPASLSQRKTCHSGSLILTPVCHYDASVIFLLVPALWRSKRGSQYLGLPPPGRPVSKLGLSGLPSKQFYLRSHLTGPVSIFFFFF
ncbi:translation initiation factor IF-2-like [Mesocricetus auratus]|uniref:Translation initiation factor IF-2-like n=1 Tax=Mesocricetus auratus TaxID=10036 RepID=A0ABM2WDT7_MESAU|nr:translation initiation factor IF-2-like [Mesocricetus auratus]